MTAVVGILNKKAMAIAADSAVTVNGIDGKKIFNKANKIFTLSKYQPVGVMIYSSADLMATPWEIIIKEYRDALADVYYESLKDYKLDFLKFLEERSYYATEQKQKFFLKYLFQLIVEDLLIGLANRIDNLDIESPPINDELRKQTIDELVILINKLKEDFKVNKKYTDFNNYSYEEFKAYSTETINEIIADNVFL